MRVTVQFFARLRELAGCRECDVDVPAGATVEDVWHAAVAAYPAIAALASSVSCAVNADFADRAAVVREDDQIAFLPPVSGG